MLKNLRKNALVLHRNSSMRSKVNIRQFSCPPPTPRVASVLSVNLFPPKKPSAQIVTSYNVKKNDLFGVAAAVAAVSAVVGAGKIWYDYSVSSDSDEENGTNAEENAPAASKEQVMHFLGQLMQIAQEFMKQLPMMEKNTLAEAKSQGLEISVEEIRAVLSQRFVEAIGDAEKEINDKMGCTPESIQAAMMKYQNDPQIVELLIQLQSLLSKDVFASSDLVKVDIPDYLTAEKVMEIMEDFTTSLTKLLYDIVEDLKGEGITDLAKSTVWQERYLSKSQELLTKKHLELNLSEEVLHAALQKYSAEPEFAARMQELYAQQQKAFQNIGLPV